MANLETVYTVILSGVNDTEYADWDLDEIEADLITFIKKAIFRFKFPKHNININEDETDFIEELTEQEAQIIGTYAIVEWLKRNILDATNIGLLYDESDYSPALFLDKLTKQLQEMETEARRLESIYYRNRGGTEDQFKPFDYSQLAG